MPVFLFLPSDKANVEVTKNGSEGVLQKLSIGSVSSGCLLCSSDGSLIRVTNDAEVVEFSQIVKGSAKVKIYPADALKQTHGSCTIEGELTWFTFMSYPQKLIIPQE